MMATVSATDASLSRRHTRRPLEAIGTHVGTLRIRLGSPPPSGSASPSEAQCKAQRDRLLFLSYEATFFPTPPMAAEERNRDRSSLLDALAGRKCRNLCRVTFAVHSSGF